MSWRPAWLLGGAVALAILGVWFFSGVEPAPPRAPAPAPAASSSRSPARPALPTPAPPPAPLDTPCGQAPAFIFAAQQNARSLYQLAWAPFGRQEVGWAIYAPFVAREIATRCSPADPAFAQALSRWQAAHQRPVTGVLSAEDFDAMRVTSHRRRPFVAAFANGCPPAANPTVLAPARPDEGYSGKQVSLRADVLSAYRSLVAAARAEDPAIRADKRMLTIFSGYRSPEEAAASCAGRDCTGPARVLCSAHRTGTALDIFVGNAPGLRPESSEDANRLFQSRTPAYRWLIENASRFGFAPYVFEPWHWEYVGGPSGSA